MTRALESFDEFLFFADGVVDIIKGESARIVREAQVSGLLDVVTGIGDPFGLGEEAANWEALPIALDRFTDDVYPRVRARVVASGDVEQAKALSERAEAILEGATGVGPLDDTIENAAQLVDDVNRDLQPFASYGAFMAGGALGGALVSLTVPVGTLQQRAVGAGVGAVIGAALGAGVRWSIERLFASVGLSPR